MSKPDDYYESSLKKRTLEDIKKCCHLKRGNKNFCCVNPHSSTSHWIIIILDELHLLLRVTDVLTRNVLDEMIEPASIGQHLKKAVDAINKCGVSFQVWEKKNADGKGSGTYDWTSLMGNEKKLLLRTFPEHFSSLLRQDTAKTVEKIWKV